MGYYQWAATLFSLVYIFLAVKNKPICFVFGILGCAIWALEDFINLNLKFDGFLQIFYVVMGFWGLYQWKFGGTNGGALPIQRLQHKYHAVLIILGVFLSLLLGEMGSRFLATDLPVLDATTTAFSIIATYLLVQRVKSAWIYFIVCDLVYVYIYGMQEAWLFVGMMAVYTIMAIVGYLAWTDEEDVENVQYLFVN